MTQRNLVTDARSLDVSLSIFKMYNLYTQYCATKKFKQWAKLPTKLLL